MIPLLNSEVSLAKSTSKTSLKIKRQKKKLSWSNNSTEDELFIIYPDHCVKVAVAITESKNSAQTKKYDEGYQL